MKWRKGNENGWLNLGGVGMRLWGRVWLLVRKGKRKKVQQLSKSRPLAKSLGSSDNNRVFGFSKRSV